LDGAVGKLTLPFGFLNGIDTMATGSGRSLNIMEFCACGGWYGFGVGRCHTQKSNEEVRVREGEEKEKSIFAPGRRSFPDFYLFSTY
jgi:hypothetical protein